MIKSPPPPFPLQESRQGLARTALRKVIRSGRLPGVRGGIGRFVGRTFGWPVGDGVRVIIENPDEYVQKMMLHCGTYEPNIQALVLACLPPGGLFFDVGANIGNHVLVPARRGARVHAFEPVPRLAERIRSNLRFNGLESSVTIVGAAAGAERGRAMIYVYPPENDGSHSLIPGIHEASVAPLEIDVITLDDYVAENSTGVPDLVKIDVEGYEARVLDGARGLMDRDPGPAFIVETADRLADQIGESAASVLGRFWSRGYRVFQVPERHGPPREVRGGDAVGQLDNFLAVRPSSPLIPALLGERAAVAV